MSVLIAALSLSIAFNIILYVRQDRLGASMSHMRFYLEAHLAKALADRRHTVTIDAENLARAFRLTGRVLVDPKRFNAKPGKHPAVVTPAKRRKL